MTTSRRDTFLRRFGRATASGHQVCAAPADAPDESFRTSVRNVGAEKGFYWGTGPDGAPHHEMERFLTKIEDLAAPAFRKILDQGSSSTDDALPRPSPPRPDIRMTVAWWLAAQILRTAPQRERLWRMSGTAADPPPDLTKANLHLQTILHGVAPLAHILYSRPWGIGLTNLCLLTSDAPTQILNARDDDDPLRAATFWDIYLPLDPHRFLYLPGRMRRTTAH